MSPALSANDPDDGLSEEEIEAMLDAVRSVPYTSDSLCGEWATMDVTAFCIAQRIVDMALPLFENEGAEDDWTAPGFLFYPNPQVSFEAFISALMFAGLPRMLAIMTDIESHIAAEMHATGYTDLGWPLKPDYSKPHGLRADGTIIHDVLSEEAAPARYLEALRNETGRPEFGSYLLKECLMFAMMPSEVARKG